MQKIARLSHIVTTNTVNVLYGGNKIKLNYYALSELEILGASFLG